MMVFINEAMTWEQSPSRVLRRLSDPAPALCPAPGGRTVGQTSFRPHGDTSPRRSAYAPWPQYDPALLVEDTLEIPVQVNGKLRDVVRVPADISKADLETTARRLDKVKPFIDGKAIKRIIVLPGKLVNIVVA